MNKSAVATIVLSTALLSGCAGKEFASCTGPTVMHPEGKCAAHYYQTDYRSGGQVTQALVECVDLPSKPGGNVVAIHSIAHGIGLKWLTPNTLEVAVPVSAALQDRRDGDTYSGTPYGTYIVNSRWVSRLRKAVVLASRAAPNNSFKPSPLRGLVQVLYIFTCPRPQSGPA